MVRASQLPGPKPLELGAKLNCRWRGTEQKPCEVIERKLKSLPDGTPDPIGVWEYCKRHPAAAHARPSDAIPHTASPPAPPPLRATVALALMKNAAAVAQMCTTRV